MTARSTPKKQATNKWARAGIIAGSLVVLLVIAVFVARWLVGLESVKTWLDTYTGHSALPDGAPVGFPAWLGWQHFLNVFFLVLIVRTGWQVRTNTRPAAHWVRNNKGLIRTKGAPTRISLDLWFHLTLDALWVLNGIIFIIVLFISGQWVRIVPTSWDIFPNALSAGLQYLSLDWPTETGWVNYNALQVLTYFVTVFIAAPLAIATGLRMSGAWPKKAAALNKAYPMELARALHFPVMIYFVAFTVVHVALVLATGVLRNLNHMYASNDSTGFAGLIIFAVSIVVIVGVWFLAQPVFLRPLASLTGKVGK
ncbi:cytochrome b/b6 domain-containing protein [Paeniglutamicibacter psychrophenolicus]|uniref:cytochrome b/b6 domain-containing protein n=1 Tax=Paeniglutamicibacter psychrophenolicus TaxID=257454 RepID=UPI00277D8FD6|nr:cytochrome b/b6 domain-containing protein [Paeniglutamicibacter psychrophenolicus]MDQ0094322.1 thiosulfate reductase cytochrome b subunit [Paeniglutamicibacter psychrophenolicus]